MKTQTLQLIHTIPGWLSDHEGQFLNKAVNLTHTLKGTVVEVGSFQGKSTIWLSQNADTVYAVDPHEGKLDNHKVSPTLTAFKEHINKAKVESKVIPLVMTSKEAAKDWNKPIRMMFIDGAHDEVNAALDFKLWNPHVVNNGIIAMHDSFCGWDGAGKVAYKKIVGSDQFKEIGVVGSIIYGIKGKPSVVERINLLRSRLFLQTANWLYKQKLPKPLSFFLIHRVLKLLLLNRFTLHRQ